MNGINKFLPQHKRHLLNGIEIKKKACSPRIGAPPFVFVTGAIKKFQTRNY